MEDVLVKTLLGGVLKGAEYRQHLLDVPQQEGFPFEIAWPVKPEFLL